MPETIVTFPDHPGVMRQISKTETEKKFLFLVYVQDYRGILYGAVTKKTEKYTTVKTVLLISRFFLKGALHSLTGTPHPLT